MAEIESRALHALDIAVHVLINVYYNKDIIFSFVFSTTPDQTGMYTLNVEHQLIAQTPNRVTKPYM